MPNEFVIFAFGVFAGWLFGGAWLLRSNKNIHQQIKQELVGTVHMMLSYHLGWKELTKDNLPEKGQHVLVFISDGNPSEDDRIYGSPTYGYHTAYHDGKTWYFVGHGHINEGLAKEWYEFPPLPEERAIKKNWR